ncbi:MAG: type II toxin-antitoxin system Phd/YefM family antitoxin [Oscillospiraceae bacterium]|jgi:PHD/YefM family antitoxin component YafN of YafNO toxin-antitoxin module|nr:type II toxin-antitoxin system Phd/YefM family antitoxin [Oscillospiraceae bacterium]
MTNTNATNFRQNIFAYLDQAIRHNEVINVSTKNGNAVVMSDEDYRGLMETLYLYSIPGMVESILDAENEPKEDRIKMSEVNWDAL